MRALEKVAVVGASVFLALTVLVTVVDLVRGTLPPALAIGAFAPASSGLIAAVLVGAKRDRDKD